MPVRLALLHTTPLVYNLFRQELALADCYHVIDEHLLRLIRGEPHSSAIADRISAHIGGAAHAGADIFLCTCSSASPYLDHAAVIGGIRLLKIDDPACRQVAARGGRVGIVCSVESTVAPTIDRLLRFAKDSGTAIMPVPVLAQGAFDALSAGDVQKHDALVLDAISAHSGEVERFLLAQASLAGLRERAQVAGGREVVTTPGACLDSLRALD